MKAKYMIVGGLLASAVITAALVSWGATDSSAPGVDQAAVVTDRSDIQSPRDAGVALARRAYALHVEEKYPAAVATYDSAAAKLPAIRDWLNVFAATSVSFLGDTADVERRLDKVDSLIAREWAWRARARAFAKAGSSKRALDIATAAASSGTASKRAAAWYLVSEIQRDLNAPAAQRAALFRAVEAAAVAESAEDAARELIRRKDLTTQEYLQVGRSLLRNGEARLGADALIKFIEATNDATLRDDVRYELGRTLFNTGEYALAERSLNRIARNHPRAADARFLAGRSQYRRGKVKEGVATFRSVVANYKGSVAATRALFSLGDLAQDNRRISDAMRYFEQAAARYELGGEDPAEALMRLGGIHYLQRKYPLAEKTFETYRKRFPRGMAYEQATYWAAQAATAAGKKDVARTYLEELNARQSFSYYDMRAAELLGKNVVGELAAGPQADTAELAPITRSLDRYDLLRDIGWSEAAAYELGMLREDFDNKSTALYAIADGLNARDHSYAAIAIGRELLNKGVKWDARLIRIMFPLPYHDIIKREARARGLDPYFVAALMRQESRFNARAVSGAGAIGLMQVMPATGRQLGGANRESLLDPEINIKLGTTFLADLMNTYGARVDAVLAAYNAGPSRMNRWRTFPEFATPDLFVERIPFDETRDYVKVVRVNTSIYRELYGD